MWGVRSVSAVGEVVRNRSHKTSLVCGSRDADEEVVWEGPEASSGSFITEAAVFKLNQKPAKLRVRILQ